MGDVLIGVYGGRGVGHQLVCGMKAVSGSNISVEARRINSDRYVTETGNALDAAKYKATHLSCASYWGPSWTGAETIPMAAEYATATSSRKQEILDEFIFSDAGSQSQNFTSINALMASWATFANTNDLIFNNYEGGYNYDLSYGDATYEAFTRDAFFSSQVYRRCQIQYDYIRSIGEFPSKYVFTGSLYSSGNPWAAIMGGLYGLEGAEWQAIKAYSRGSRRYRIKSELV